jgi:putative ABC transport system permease protein
VLRVALRGALSRKLRLLLTALSIALGVGFVAGAYVLTDTMTYAFTSLFTKTGAKVDVYVQAPSHYSDQRLSWAGGNRAPVPASLVAAVERAPGVKVASGEVIGFAQIVAKDGKAITTSGAPTLGTSAPGDPSLSSVTMRTGREPVRDGEISIDAQTARTHDFHVGDPVTVLFQGPTRSFTLVGIFGFDEVDSMAGATVVTFDLATAQQVMGKSDTYDDIAVKAAPGWSQERLRDSVAQAIGGRWEVITGQQQSNRTLDAVQQVLGFFSAAMLAFAAIALFVGAFIIFNTFSILVAQRTREFGLLRAIGASARQVVVVVIVEALAVGTLASLVGLGLGAGIAVLLTRLMGAIGIELPPAPLQYQTRTVLAAMAVGIGVTLLAALGPALRTRGLSPMAALQSGLTGERRRSARRRLTLGVPATAVGLGLLLAGMTGRTGHGLLLFLCGAVAIFLGATVLSPFVIRPTALAIGWPLARLFHLPARLGLRNAMRSPARTARTAAALMVGLALISLVTIVGASMKASATKAIDDVLTADYLVTPTAQGPGAAFSPQVAESIRPLPGVAAIGQIRAGFMERDGALQTLGGTDAASLAAVTNITVLSGDLLHIDKGGVAIGKNVAAADGLGVGDVITMTFDATGPQRVPVVAVYDDAQGSARGEYLIGMRTFADNYTTRLDSFVAVKLAAGADSAAVGAMISKAISAYPNVQLQDHMAFRNSVLAQVDQLLALVYALLTLAVVISLLGIVNTLALSTIERGRELGLLRAVGMSRRDVRAMVRYEAVIVAVLGAVFGLVVGVLFAAVALAALRDSGLGVAAYPVGELAMFVALSALAGVLAAVVPARRASRVDILQAITSE